MNGRSSIYRSSIGFLLCPLFALSACVHEPLRCETVPVPAAASKQLRAAIEYWPCPNEFPVAAVPATRADWVNAIQESDKRGNSAVQQLLAKFPVEVTTSSIAGIQVYRVAPLEVLDSHEHRLFLHLHGGAYVFGGGEQSLSEAILIANRIGIRVMSIDYRMPPDFPFPAAIDDVVTVYESLLSSYDPSMLVIGGTSAGGGLSLAAIHRLRSLNLPMPGAVFAGTPWADLTKTGDTMFTNEGLDRVLVKYDGLLSAAARLYAGQHDLKDPLISPVYGEFDAFPPTILFSGTRDLFLSDVVRVHRKMRRAGTIAELHLYEGMSHAGYLLAVDTPESLDIYRELDIFIRRHVLWRGLP